MRRLKVWVEPLLAAGAVCGITLPGWAATAAMAVAYFIFPKRNAVAFMLAALAGVISLECGNLLLFSPRHYEKQLPHRNVYGSFKLVVTDMRVTNQVVEPPGLIQCDLLAMKLNGENEFIPISGRTMLRFGERCPAPSSLRCGSQFSVEGRLELPDGDDFFSRYLASRHCRRLLRPDKIQETGVAASVRSKVAALRDGLLKRTLKGLERETGELAAAMLFGLTGGLDDELKRDFLHAGSIHLFSVSGMHVAVLAGLLFLLSRPLPRSWRDWPVLAGVLLYAFSTGMAPPAVRASVCIAIWCVLRINLYETTPIRMLAICAAGMLIVNPALVGDTGFLYSFVITAALLMAVSRWGEFTGTVKELDAYRPQIEFRRRNSRVRRIALATGGTAVIAIVAFAASSVISMYSNALLLPGSAAANLLIAPLLPPIFAVWFVKITAGACFVCIDSACVWAMTFLCRILASIAGGSAELWSNLAAVRPSPVGIAMFYAGLLTSLVAANGKLRLAGAAVALAMLLWWPLAVRFELPAVMAAGDSANRPVTAAVIEPARGRGTLFAIPGGRLPATVADFFMRRGVPKLERLIIPMPSKRDAAGLKQLVRRLPVERVEISAVPGRYRRDFTEAISGVPATQSVSEAIKPKKNGVEDTRRFEYFNPGSKLSLVLECADADDGRHLTLSQPGHEPITATLPYCSKPEIWIYEFR